MEDVIGRPRSTAEVDDVWIRGTLEGLLGDFAEIWGRGNDDGSNDNNKRREQRRRGL